LLPKKFRYYLFRRALRLHMPPSELTVKLADTREELEAALTVLHDSYVQEGLMKPHPSGMRLTKYHALPSTSTFVAKWNGEVVGTLSVIRDSTFGFPSEKVVDVSALRAQGARIAEPSGLAVRKDFQHRQGGLILFALIKYLTNYCFDYFGVDYWVIAVNPKNVPLYEGILFFDQVASAHAKHYEYVNGAPAVGLFVNLEDFYMRLLANYWRLPQERNLFNYLFRSFLPKFVFPNRKFFKISDPFLTPESLKYFFSEKSDTFEVLSENERLSLRSVYDLRTYGPILPAAKNLPDPKQRRKEPRFEGKFKGKISCAKQTFDMVLIQVGPSGFGAVVDGKLLQGQAVNAKVAIGGFEVAVLRAVCVWCGGNNLYGFSNLSCSENWSSFIHYLQEDLDRAVSSLLQSDSAKKAA